LGELHAQLPPGLERSDHQPADPPDVLEIWFLPSGREAPNSTCGKYGYYVGLFYDWQTLVAGVLALLAGLGAIIAANRQVKPAKKQTATMRLIERERIARETYAFFAMLEAAMQTVIDDAKAAMTIFAEQTYDVGDSTLAYDARQKMGRKAFAELRGAFLCRDSDGLVAPFLRLDREIDEFAAPTH
jgi:hypothetical protein